MNTWHGIGEPELFQVKYVNILSYFSYSLLVLNVDGNGNRINNLFNQRL